MPSQQFVIPATPILLPLSLILVLSAAYGLKRRAALTTGRLVLLVTVAVYAVAVLAVTLLPLQVALGTYANQVPWYAKLNFIPVVTIDPRTFVLNIAMTGPLGALAPLLIRVITVRRAALLGFLVSLTIEIVQGLTNVFFSSGRTADVNDLLANTIGAALGWYALRRLLRLPVVGRLYDWLRLPSGARRGDLTRGTGSGEERVRSTSGAA